MPDSCRKPVGHFCMLPVFAFVSENSVLRVLHFRYSI